MTALLPRTNLLRRTWRPIVRRSFGSPSSGGVSQILVERLVDEERIKGGTITQITLNRPKANAMGKLMIQELGSSLDSLENETQSRCVVITSFSDKVFSAGADLKERKTMTQSEAADFVTLLRNTMERDSVAVTFSILDRFLAIKLKEDEEIVICRETFQLYCMASLHISVKMGASIRRLRLETLVDMAQGLFQAKDIADAELEILQALKWHVAPPTIMQFVGMYANLLPSHVPESVYTSCEYMADLALADEFFIPKSASLVALCILLTATQQEGLSLIESRGLLKNLQGLVHVKGETFDCVLQRLECLS